MQDYVIDHVILVLGLVEAEGAAEVLLMRRFRLTHRVTSLHVHLQGFPNKKIKEQTGDERGHKYPGRQGSDR